MVCSILLKRWITWMLAAVMLMLAVGLPQESWAKSRRQAKREQVQESLLTIQSVRLNPDGSGLLVEANRSFTGEDTKYFTALKLPNPNRVLLDIPNARLANGPATLNIGQQGIQQVELAENGSQFYSSVRIIVYVSDSQTLSRLQTAFDGTQLRVETGAPAVATVPPVPGQPAPPSPTVTLTPPPVPPGTVASTSPVPIPADATVIEDVYLRDNRLVIQAGGRGDLRVKDRFTLSGPNRLVLDFEKAVVGSRALLTPMGGASSEFRQVRLGQFDEDTVRLVIETPNPELFEVVYPGGDHRELSISPHTGTSITRLAANTHLGYVKDLALRREAGSMVVALNATEPIVHRLQKKDGRVFVELLNVAAAPTKVGFDPKFYPELKGLRFEPLTAGEPNSQFLVELADPDVQITPRLSEDKKTLEITLSQTVPFITNIGMGAAGGARAPFPARIVLDAGHGGKDMGANRDGVYEKDLNLSLALMVRDELQRRGFQVIMTRSTDVFLPLPTITAITNKHNPDLFVSIHHNASTNPAIHGIETYWYTPQSRALADKIHRRKINAVGARDGGVKRAMFYVIHHTRVPAVLCEVGYVSNAEERRELQTLERKQKTARAIADGVVDYLKSRMAAQAAR